MLTPMSRATTSWLQRRFLVAALRGSAWSLVGQIVAKLSILLISISGAKALDLNAFGSFSTLQVVSLVAPVLWDFGMSGYLTRETASGNLSLRTALTTGFSARVFTLPLFLGIWALAVSMTDLPPSAQMVAPWLFLASIMTSVSMLLSALLQGQLQFGLSNSAVITARCVTTLGLLAAMLVGHASPSWVSAIYFIGETIGAVAMLIASRHLLPWSAPEHRSRTELLAQTWSSLRAATPYAMGSAVQMGYNKLDLLMVVPLAGSAQAGLYAPATRLQDGLATLPSVATAGLMPVAAARLKEHDGDNALRRAQRKAALICFVAVAPFAAALALTAPWLVPKIYGPAFVAAVPAVIIISLSTIFTAYNAPAVAFLIARGRARSVMNVHIMTLAVAVSGHLALDPTFGANGAAAVAVFREAFMALALHQCLRAAPRLLRVKAVHDV
jgi:O-antigen/teichoic acid export membrane protein